MKNLEELGISPTPWKKVNEYGFLKFRDSEGYDVACVYGEDDKNIIANGNVLAASPKMYKYLSEAVEMQCYDCKGGDCYNCQVGRWKDALAEASGEVEK